MEASHFKGGDLGGKANRLSSSGGSGWRIVRLCGRLIVRGFLVRKIGNNTCRLRNRLGLAKLDRSGKARRTPGMLFQKRPKLRT
jgi:hypothetical protein